MPVLLLAVLAIGAKAISGIPGRHAWLVFVGMYWAIGLILMAPMRKRVFKAMREKASPGALWKILPFITVPGSAVLFTLNMQEYLKLDVLLIGLVFSVVNPLIEEGLWRVYFDELLPLAFPVRLLYANAVFSLMHFLALGQISRPNAEWVIVPIILIAGLVWALSYRKTKTLKYAIVSHGMMDFLSCTQLFVR